MLVDKFFRDSYYDLGFCSPVHPTAVLLIFGTNDMSPHSNIVVFNHIICLLMRLQLIGLIIIVNDINPIFVSITKY